MFDIYTFLLTIINTTLIFFLIYSSKSRVLYKIDSPIVVSLYGIFMFYVFPVFYWLFNDWPFNTPTYFEGQKEVQFSIMLFLIPLLIFPKNIKFNFQTQLVKYSKKSIYLIYFIVALVLFNSFYETFILGNQGRFEFQSYESDSIFYLATSLFHDYGLCFIFLLFLSDDYRVRRNGNILLVILFIPTLLSFHRFAILIYCFQIFIFFILTNRFTIKPFKLLLYSFLGIIFIVGFIGRFGIEGIVYLSDHNTSSGSLSFSDILIITKNVISNFSFTTNIKPSIWDEIFLRLNQSRSASAVIHNFTNQSNFYFGLTFVSLFFFFIPRFIFPSKPDMSSVHLITTEFMGTDFGGVNPLGSIAEVYINFGYYGIMPISILFHFFFILLIKLIHFLKNKITYFICFYPYFAFMFFAFDLNLSQRIVQLSKATFFFLIVTFFINKKVFRIIPTNGN